MRLSVNGNNNSPQCLVMNVLVTITHYLSSLLRMVPCDSSNPKLVVSDSADRNAQP